MAKQVEAVSSATDIDPFQCEYVPFGAQDKIKLSFNIILKWLAVKTAKGEVPSEQDLTKFLMTCKAKKLNPFDGDAFLIGYDGKDGPVFSTIVAHQAFLKRAETHPEFDGMESGVIVQTGDTIVDLVGDFFPASARLLGGWATVFFVNRRHPMTKRLKLSTFDKGRSLWKTNPEGMIVKCAEADALRSSFPQLIGGMYLREEMGTDADRASAERHFALNDRRSEEIPAPFSETAKARAFVDSAGQAVNGGRTPRYDQDAAAAAVSERIRAKVDGVKDVASQQPLDDAAATAHSEQTREQFYNVLLTKCLEVKSVADGVREQAVISRCLTEGRITDEQACDLNDTLKANLENLA